MKAKKQANKTERYTKIDNTKLIVAVVKCNSQTVLKPNTTSCTLLFMFYRVCIRFFPHSNDQGYKKIAQKTSGLTFTTQTRFTNQLIFQTNIQSVEFFINSIFLVLKKETKNKFGATVVETIAILSLYRTNTYKSENQNKISEKFYFNTYTDKIDKRVIERYR